MKAIYVTDVYKDAVKRHIEKAQDILDGDDLTYNVRVAFNDICVGLVEEGYTQYDYSHLSDRDRLRLVTVLSLLGYKLLIQIEEVYVAI